ncbi:hypothetical protein EXE44_07370 [Halorubrum sp. SS7]|uniref:hypothetical protein n=2 Tax=unclassified Halorubrum TaxID=2642239 RepID=UPI0010F8B7BF|nr:hypothetical protein [Halorubrum sp. SS7]TKX58124.1 hypothetical protein EXE44_07370 [Halorubrum sp. SS7]
MGDTDESTGVSAWAVFKPFRRPLPLNLLVPCVGLVCWYVGFEATVAVLGLSPELAADSVAGQVARTKATLGANLGLGAFVGLATLRAYGWHIWNVLVGAAFAVNGGAVAFWIRGATPPAEFYRTPGYVMSDPELLRVLALALAFVVPAAGIFFLGMEALYRSPDEQRRWWSRLPK